MTTLVTTASAQHRVIADMAAITAPVGATLRYSFVSVGHATGLSTVTALAMRELVRNRWERVLSVDTRPGQSSRDVLRDGEMLSDERFARLPSTTRQWMRHNQGLVAVAFEGGTLADWHHVIAPVIRHFDIVGTDWGTLPLLDAAHAALTGDAVCITGTYDRESAESAIAFARALVEQTNAARPVVVLSDLTGTRSTWPRLVATRLPFPLVSIPHDPSLRAGRKPTATTLGRARSLAAVLRRRGTESDRRP